MRFLDDRAPLTDSTYDDVFMVPGRSAVASRLDVDLATPDGTGTTIPLVVANMTAVAGRRMAETVARRGGLAVIPQDIPVDVVAEVIAWVKARDLVHDTPITLAPHDTVGEALSLLPKRAHGAVIVVDGTTARSASSPRPTARASTASPSSAQVMSARAAHAARRRRRRGRRSTALYAGGGTGSRPSSTATARSPASSPAPARCAPRSTRRPLDAAGRLRVAAAIGINGDVAGRGASGCSRPAPTCSCVDTAHGHQERDARRAARPSARSTRRVPIVGGQRRDRARACATSSRPARTSSRSASAPAPCARRA